MIDVQHVYKQYQKNINVVSDVSFHVRKNQIFGLLGPNGSGKTTLMQMIATLLSPTRGKITVCDLDTSSQEREIRKHIGFLTSEVKLDPFSTPDKLFDFFGDLYRLDRKEAVARKEESFERFGISPFSSKRIVELSTGMKQKISIAISLIHNPPVIIFDEPTNGLDILTARQVTDYLLALRDSGHAVLLSTHIFSVAEALCDELAIIVDGRIVAQGSVPEIRQQNGTDTFEKAFFKLYTEFHKE